MHAGSSVHRAATAIIPLTVSPARWSGTTLASAHAWKGTASGPVTRYPASTRRSLKSHRHRSHRASPRSGSQLAPRLASRRTASMSTGHSRDTPGAPICARAAEEQCRRRSTSEAPRLFPRRARRGGREGWRTNPPRGFARGARGDARRARGGMAAARGRDDARGDAGRRRARAREEARRRERPSAPPSPSLGPPRAPPTPRGSRNEPCDDDETFAMMRELRAVSRASRSAPRAAVRRFGGQFREALAVARSGRARARPPLAAMPAPALPFWMRDRSGGRGRGRGRGPPPGPWRRWRS